MRSADVRVGARVSGYLGEGEIIKVEMSNKRYVITVKRDDGVYIAMDSSTANLINEPTFEDPIIVHVHGSIFQTDIEFCRNRSIPLYMEPRRGYIPLLFEREDIQDIVDRVQGSVNNLWCTRRAFFKLLREIKDIYVGLS